MVRNAGTEDEEVDKLLSAFAFLENEVPFLPFQEVSENKVTDSGKERANLNPN